MAIPVTAHHKNPTIPPGTGSPGGTRIFSGVVECVFKGPANGSVGRDALTFLVGRVDIGTLTSPPTAACVASPASFGHDGGTSAPLWAVDSAKVTQFRNVDSGSGTADLEVVINVAVRGADAFILRVNYSVYYFPA